MKRASFVLGVGTFRAKFYGNGVVPRQNVDIVRYVVDCATIMPPEVFRQRNFVADFWSKFLRKTTNLGI